MAQYGAGRIHATVGVISSLAILSCAYLYYRSSRRSKQTRHEGFQAEKPQKKFRRVLADNTLAPFVHLQTEESGSDASHPYDRKLRALLEHPPVNFSFMQPSYEKPCETEKPFEWIETRDKLEALVQVLSVETEFAVDTEQHSFHSFHGFTSLVQISTEKIIYLVDSIALHDSMNILGPAFSNPAICKVFHGADSDILWLQRDFHIYVVNMFDTAQACRILGKPQSSLAYLLNIYCGVSTNKVFQRADWRVRPLPEDMLLYACTDVHYLLHIAHQLCVELVRNTHDNKEGLNTDMEGIHSEQLLEQAIRRSNLTCLQLYEKDGVCASPTSTATSLVSRFYNSHGLHPSSQVHEGLLSLVTSLCEWRDIVARTEDESLRSVLSDTALVAVATSSPSTLEQIYATIVAADTSTESSEVSIPGIVPSLVSPSPIVKHYINDLHNVIQNINEGPPDESLSSGKLGELKADSKPYFYTLIEMVFSHFKVAGNVENGNGNQSKDCSLVSIERKMPRKWRRGDAEKSRTQFVKKFSCKAPVYHNCRIYADDGRLLCFCDRKKLEWYVSRGLAEFVQEEPPAVRLLFEPKGRPEDEDNDFYIQSKSNRCVGCGESSHYLRYRIIPSCYRQHFPEHLKSHRSHDIVLLCVDCHEVAHKSAEKHKRQIAMEYGVPLFVTVMESDKLVGKGKKTVVYSEGEGGVSPLQLKNAAMALLRHGSTIPSQRRAELEEVVCTYYRRDTISQQDLHAVLLLSMGPQEQRRWLRKVSNQGDISTLADIPDQSAVQASSSHGSPPFEGESQISLREKEGESVSSAGTEQSMGSKSLDSSTRPADIAVSYGSGSQSLLLKGRSGKYKVRKNESLLGHGVHGKRVVEILKQGGGDEAIRNFSQQWRKVFVESLQPAFLPIGWDISHSGRREFGDFSVYKPLAAE